MVDARWNIHTADFGTLIADGNVSDSLHSLTRGETTSFNFRFRFGVDDLVVADGETYTIPAGTTETYSTVTVESGGTLNEDGTLVVLGEGTGEPGWRDLQKHADYAGTYSINESLTGKPNYNQRLPADADVSSLVLGIEPSTDLQNKDVTGIWGLLESGTDQRNNPLTSYNYEISVVVLAEYDEFTRTELSNELEITL